MSANAGAARAPHSASEERDQDRCIAVVTVCRNPGRQLAQAIESVAALRDPRIRHIVIDGASTDGTVAYLRSLDSSSCQWISEADGGIYDAMNKGWTAAPTDAYVIMIGADDRLLSVPTPNELRRAEKANCPIVYGCTHMGAKTFRSRFDGGIRFRNTLHHQSMMVRKDVAAAPPFDTRYRIYGDWDFNLRLWCAGIKAIRIESLTAYAAPGGASARRPLKEAFLIAYRNIGWWAGIIAWAAHIYGGLRTTFGDQRPGSPQA